MTFELSTNKYLFDIKIIIEEYNENFSGKPTNSNYNFIVYLIRNQQNYIKIKP